MKIAWVCEPTELEWDLKRAVQDHDIDLTIWSVTDFIVPEPPADRALWSNDHRGRMSMFREIADMDYDLIVLRYPYWFIDRPDEIAEARRVLEERPVVVWLSEQGPMRWWAKKAAAGWDHVAVNNRFEINLYHTFFPYTQIHYMPVGCAAWRDDELIPDEQYRTTYLADGLPHYKCEHWNGWKALSVRVMIEPFLSERLSLYGDIKKHPECSWNAHPYLKLFYKGQFKPDAYPSVYPAADVYLGLSWNWAFSGYGIKLARAMSTGVPIIWHRTPYSEWDGLKEGREWLCASEPEETVKHAQWLQKHDQYRVGIGQAGRQFAVTNWEWGKNLIRLANEVRQDYKPTRYWKKASAYALNRDEIYPEHYPLLELDQHKGKVVLEYGCGGGVDALRWKEAGAIVQAVDIVAENVEATRERIGYAVLIPEGEPLPIAPAFADVVSAQGVLHHIPDVEPVVRDLVRALRPGGLLYAMLYTEHYEARGKFQPDGVGCPYVRSYTEAQGKALFEKAGLTVLSATEYNHGDFRMFKAVK